MRRPVSQRNASLCTGREGLFLLSLLMMCCLPLRAADQTDAAGERFFENRIRPVLVQHCYACHSSRAKTLEGELRLDHRDGIRKGGESGPAVVPGDVKKSLLISALRYDDFEMPPKKQLKPLSMKHLHTLIPGPPHPPCDPSIEAAGQLDHIIFP